MSELENCCGTTCNKTALAEELAQFRKAAADRTAELEQVKRAANELAAQLQQLRANLNSKTDIANQLKDNLSSAFQRELELKSQLVEVNENRTGVSPCARFCEALAAKKMFDNLQRERDELAAQVEQLNQRNNELEVMQPSYNLLRNAFYDGACWNESTINNGALSLDKNAHEYANEKLAELTPAKCLAEHDREVAKRAVEKAAIECKVLIIEGGARWLCRVDTLEQYANKIKSGEVDI